METITIKTSEKKQFIDITSKVNTFLALTGKSYGVCHLFVLHSSSALIIGNMNISLPDLLQPFEKITNESYSTLSTQFITTLLGVSLTISFQNAELILGNEQKVILVELAGPTERSIRVTLL